MGSKARLLIVDDNEDGREMYAEYLRFAGHTVMTAADGQAALAAARTFRPDVIVLDLSIPVVDGWQVAAALRGAKDTAGICIVAVTGHGEPQHVARASEAGCDHVLVKPVEPRALAECIDTMLSSRGERSSAS